MTIKLMWSLFLLTFFSWGLEVSMMAGYCLWGALILWTGFSSSSSFVRLLLLLEVMVMGGLLFGGVMSMKLGVSFMLMYFLMLFSVGEAVVGLSLLVVISQFRTEKVLSIKI